MRLTVNDLQEVRVKQRPSIRFSVSVVADDGEPLWTSQGWLMGPDREIAAPAVMTRMGLKRYHILAPRFCQMLRAAIEKNFPQIEEFLGVPQVEGMTNFKGEGIVE